MKSHETPCSSATAAVRCRAVGSVSLRVDCHGAPTGSAPSRSPRRTRRRADPVPSVRRHRLCRSVACRHRVRRVRLDTHLRRYAQLGMEPAPRRELPRLGHLAGHERLAVRSPGRCPGGGQQRRRVGMSWAPAKSSAVGACSTTWPAYITAISSESSEISARSWVTNSTARSSFSRSSLQQFDDLRLIGHVERRRRLVGDEQARVAAQGHGDHHPLAHPTRELVRVGRRAAARDRGCARSRAARRRGPAPRSGSPSRGGDRLDQLVPDGEGRIEAGQRVLKTIAMSRPRIRRSSSKSASSRFSPVEADGTPDDVRRRRGQ